MTRGLSLSCSFSNLVNTKVMIEEDFEEMLTTIRECDGLRLSEDCVQTAPLDCVMLEAVRRLAEDAFFTRLGKRLYVHYFMIRWLTDGIFAWLFQEEDLPSFLVGSSN